MIKRGYELFFYAWFTEEIHIRMFHELGVDIHLLEELNEDGIKECDFIYSAAMLDSLPQLLNVPKYIFTFTTVFMDEPLGFADFTFTQRDMGKYLQRYEYSMERINEIKSIPGLKVGNPKFDFEEDAVNLEQNEKQILFIDAGHFPFGKKGKCAVAEMLLNIAKTFPDYKVIIKPRFLKTDQNVTHKNVVNLYDCLYEVSGEKIPENIICLQNHTDLERLVRNSRTVVTTDMTTSYLDIAAYNKKGIIATEIPSEESLTHNKGHVKRFLEISHRSGLCVPYKNIVDYLPSGKSFSEVHKREMGIGERQISVHMVDVMEMIYMDFIKRGRYPGLEADFRDEKNTLTMEEVINIRHIKHLYTIMQIEKYRIEELDFSNIENFIYGLLKHRKSFNRNNYAEYCKKIKLEVRNTILNSREILMENAMKQSYYLQAVFDAERIHLEDENQYDAKEMYWFLLGKYEISKRGNAEQAIKLFDKYFDGIGRNDYEKTLADIQYCIESATYWSGVCCFELGMMERARKYFEKCQVLTNNKHRKANEYLNYISERKM